MRKKKIYLFDLDGVLINSKKNMQVSWEAVNRKYDLKVSFKDYFKLIGMPFYVILRKLKIKPTNYEKISKEYNLNSIKNIKYIKLQNGVIKTLNILKKNGKIIGILTSKEKIRTKKILKKLKIKLNLVLCPQRNLIGKPNPKQINELSKKRKVQKNQMVYIGDMNVDKLTAKNAKIDYIHAKYGYSKKIKSKYSIKNIEDIISKNLGLN
jgi:phosphoglycolate phosphatase